MFPLFYYSVLIAIRIGTKEPLSLRGFQTIIVEMLPTSLQF